ncbi:hypothetical protein PIB30_021342 [Stylosanthes scabra]|uniref:Zinc finger GRF-type domain-containing protein n=1 Tax=Stylosanthes scabra TaxID=79078 RepID=A0ABU6Q9X1_9FABA|nr:hypothetical protein [Stylosanthes scabra]
MESDGCRSASRQSGGSSAGAEQSSSTQGIFTAKVSKEWDGAAPKCHCRVYAVLYLSKTSKNPNRLFFGCPFFKISFQYWNFFLWLDHHTVKFEKKNDLNVVKEEGEEYDVEVHFRKLRIENKVAELEGRVCLIEKKNLLKTWLGWICVIGVFMSLFVKGLK